MGKEHDLLQAAKSGNVAHIEKILGHKARKSGIQGYVSCRKCEIELIICSHVGYNIICVFTVLFPER